MAREMFPVTTLGERPSLAGSVQLYKNKLIFQLPCPISAATSRAAALLDESLPWQNVEGCGVRCMGQRFFTWDYGIANHQVPEGLFQHGK